MACILVVGPRVEEVSLLARYLTEAGYDVVSASRGAEALRLARRGDVDLIVLDAAVVDVAATEVVRLIRADRASARTPVVVVSEHSDEIERVVAFEVGADDFVGKPYSHRELVLRVQAIVRRVSSAAPPADVGSELGGLVVDRRGHRVTVGGVSTDLSGLELELLVALYRRRDRVQTRDALLAEVWCDVEGVSERTVDACVKRLRLKLGPAGAWVETVRGVGYRFVTPPSFGLG